MQRTVLRILLIGVVCHVYVGLRLVLDAPVGTGLRWAAVAALVLSCVLIPAAMLTRRARRPPLGGLLAWVGLLAMGFFSSLLVLTLLRDVLLLALALALAASGALAAAGASSGGWFDAWRGFSALAVPALALLATALGVINARRTASVVRVDVPLDDLPPALEGFTIAQISDLHVGPTIRRRYLDAIVRAVNALGADLIVITGDLVDGAVEVLAPHTAPLAKLVAPYGVYVVTGNHEYYSGANAWIAEFQRLGLRVLLNEHVVLERHGEPLVLAGVTDYSAAHYDASHRSDPHAALAGAPAAARVKVLLAHQPRSAVAAAAAGFTVQLSGHTHGGQFFPWNYFVRVQQPFTAGLARLGRLWVYTSRGTGYWGPPVRLCAPSEITRIRLVRA